MNDALRISHPFRGRLSRMALSGLLLWPLAPSLARACRMEVVGNPAKAWRSAASGLSLNASDCSTLRLQVQGDAALLSFTTLDGRTAERVLAHPSELAPALEALLVTGVAEAEEAEGAGAESERAVPEDAPAAAGRAGGADRRDVEALFPLLAGGRAGDSARVSPVIGAGLLVRIRGWEVGAFTQVEAHYFNGPRFPNAHSESWAIAHALSFARRQPVAKVTLLAGVRLGMAVLERVVRGRQPEVPQGLGLSSLPTYGTPQHQYEPRASTFLGVVLPTHPLARLRLELAADFAFLSRSSDAFRIGPSWALGLLVGVELGMT